MSYRFLFKKPSFILGVTVVGSIILFGIIGPLVTRNPLDKVRDADGRLLINHPPGLEALLGTDQQAQDFLANLAHGTFNSLLIGLFAGLLTLLIAVIIGGIASFKGGLIDEFGMLITNIVLVFPVLPSLLVISAYLEYRSLELVILFIGFISWPWAARAVRGQILSLRERDFVNLARVTGMGDLKIALFEVLPHMLAYLALVLTIATGAAILTEAGISMIGLGPTRVITLGVLLQWAIENETIRLGYYWLFFFPGLILTVLMFFLYVIQANMDAVFNPRLREE
ncbi:MAG: ABC transporter permease [Candidatus Hermodarchaeota archaeon]